MKIGDKINIKKKAKILETIFEKIKVRNKIKDLYYL
jgi:hypothetical protein